MGKFIINGSAQLSGRVDISGSKNAALPLIFAAITTRGKSVFHNVPNISDVEIALELISSLGAEVFRCGDDLIIKTSDLKYKRPDDFLVAKIRASSYLLGADLARFGICHLQSFGGCNFDNRPVDMHIYAMTALGAQKNGDSFVADELFGSDVFFGKISVGATVNALILAASAKGKTRIFGYAKEPHVIALIDFLRSAGATISVFDDRVEVIGAELHGAEATVIPDMIEAGTYAALSLLTNSKIEICGAEPLHLDSFLKVILSSGASYSFTSNDLLILHGTPNNHFDVVTQAYPGYPTDLQPQLTPIMARFCGGSITENVWVGRFGYLGELEKFGVRYTISKNCAYIYKSRLHCAEATAPDLRGGAALLMCALACEGKSVVDSSEIIKRGYSDVIKKLRILGADIEEI